jgi:hypothetical protein
MNYRANSRVEELRQELTKLMLEQIESLKTQTFDGSSEKNLREEEARLKRIREVSGDFIAAVKADRT